MGGRQAGAPEAMAMIRVWWVGDCRQNMGQEGRNQCGTQISSLGLGGVGWETGVELVGGGSRVIG